MNANRPESPTLIVAAVLRSPMLRCNCVSCRKHVHVSDSLSASSPFCCRFYTLPLPHSFGSHEHFLCGIRAGRKMRFRPLSHLTYNLHSVRVRPNIRYQAIVPKSVCCAILRKPQTLRSFHVTRQSVRSDVSVTRSSMASYADCCRLRRLWLPCVANNCSRPTVLGQDGFIGKGFSSLRLCSVYISPAE